MKRFFVLFFSLLLLAVKPVFAATYPNPTGFVNDFANVLTTDQKNTLEQNLESYEKQTGNEISVAIFKSLNGDTIDNFAVKLEEQWQVGKKGQDNGVLLVIAMDEHQYRFEVGYGLEPVLTDATVGDIGRNYLVPAFKNGNYYQGISDSVNAMEQKIGTLETAPKKQNTEDASGIIFIIFLIILIIIFSKRKKKKDGGPWDFLFGWILGSTLGGGGRGFGGGGGGSGFGGFGGGSSGGGGASGSW